MANDVVLLLKNEFSQPRPVQLIDLSANKKIEASVQLGEVLNSSLVLNAISSSEETLGTMIINFKGKRNLTIILLDNYREDEIGHVGKELVETAKKMAQMLNKSVSVFATKNSHVFYWKCGFRTFSNETNQKIELAMEEGLKQGRKANTEKLGGLTMFLSEP